MNKTISMSIRVSEEELDKLKQAARLEAYASYSEFVRRTALIEATRVIAENDPRADYFAVDHPLRDLTEKEVECRHQ